MTNPNGLVQQLLETVQQRMEGKVLERLDSAGGATHIAGLIDTVFAEEQADLESRAAVAEAGGEKVQAEMYRLIRSELLPQVAAALRGRLQSS